jgi:hypothetical protein
MTALLNSHFLYQILKNERFLSGHKSYTQYKEALKGTWTLKPVPSRIYWEIIWEGIYWDGNKTSIPNPVPMVHFPIFPMGRPIPIDTLVSTICFRKDTETFHSFQVYLYEVGTLPHNYVQEKKSTILLLYIGYLARSHKPSNYTFLSHMSNDQLDSSRYETSLLSLSYSAFYTIVVACLLISHRTQLTMKSLFFWKFTWNSWIR